MITRRLAVPIAALLAGSVVLSACSGSSGSASPTTSAAPAASTSSSGASAAVNPQAAALAAAAKAALATVSSAHISIDASSLLGTAAGTIRAHAGTVTASDLTVKTAGKSYHVVTVGSTSYAQLPGGSVDGKPWALVSSSSKNEFVRGLAGTMTLLRSVADLNAVAGLLGAATTVTPKGAAVVNGVKTQQFRLVLNPKAAAASGAGQLQALLTEVGSGTVPADVWVDAQHRPVKITLHASVTGTSLAIGAELSKYNAPVTISAPPASQVAH